MPVKLRLTVELVPRGSWGDNLRSRFPRATWDEIRRHTYAAYGHVCGACGASAKLDCHEIWHYDDKHHIQQLRGFIALCGSCHAIKHLGRTINLGKQGKIDLEKVQEHFLRVNRCDRRRFAEYVKTVFEEWTERSKHRWQVDLAEYEKLAAPK